MDFQKEKIGNTTSLICKERKQWKLERPKQTKVNTTKKEKKEEEIQIDSKSNINIK